MLIVKNKCLKNIEEPKRILIAYYKENLKRMRYSAFKKRGLLIGSGAIESAHRNVLQEREAIRSTVDKTRVSASGKFTSN